MADTFTGNSNNIAVRALVGAVCSATIFMASPAAADVKSGVDAWSQGDFSRAVEEWQGPAQAGDPDALFNLAQAYRLGRGVDADVARARDLYAAAASRGHVKAADNYGLLLFQQGQQTSAMPLITAAADRGDPRAQYVLGLAHFNGDYASKDWVQAYALLTLSNSSGLPQAKDALAQMDQYVPIEQRRLAQSVAREIEDEAARLRAAELASVELDRMSPGTSKATTSAVVPKPSTIPAAASTNFSLESRTSAVSTAPARAVPQRVTSADGPWLVQLGAFGVRGNADRLWNKLSGRSALAGKRKVLVPAGKLTKLQAGGFASRGAAQTACDSLKASGQGCIVTRK